MQAKISARHKKTDVCGAATVGYQVGYKFTWQTIPLAALTDEGPVRNPYFLATVKEAFPNTMSRMLVVRPCALPSARRFRSGHTSMAICTRVAPTQWRWCD